jgi:hypothetical protein
MTDPNDFDELASAHLDGVTSPEEAARVEADPALRARVEELRVVRTALGDVPAVDPARRDAAIAAAVAAFGDEGAERDTISPPAAVTPLATRRLSPTTVRVLSAAAVVALLALLVPLLGDIGGGDDDPSSESAGEATVATGDAGTESDEAPQDSATTTLPGVARDADLGSYDDVDALADAVTTGGLDTPAALSPQSEQHQSTYRVCGSAPATSTWAGTAVVAGERVVLWVRVTPDGRQLLTVLRTDDCTVIDQREL